MEVVKVEMMMFFIYSGGYWSRVDTHSNHTPTKKSVEIYGTFICK